MTVPMRDSRKVRMTSPSHAWVGSASGSARSRRPWSRGRASHLLRYLNESHRAGRAHLRGHTRSTAHRDERGCCFTCRSCWRQTTGPTTSVQSGRWCRVDDHVDDLARVLCREPWLSVGTGRGRGRSWAGWAPHSSRSGSDTRRRPAPPDGPWRQSSRHDGATREDHARSWSTKSKGRGGRHRSGSAPRR